MKKKVLISLLTIIICCTSGLYSFATSVSDMKDKQDDIENERKEAEKQEKQIEIQKSQTLSKLQDLNTQISDSERQLSDLNAQIKELQENITQLEKDIVVAQEKYNAQQEALEKRVVAQYKTGKTSFLDVLLNSTNLSSFISNYYLVGKIAKADNELLDSIETEKQKIETKKSEVEQQKASLTTAKANIQKENTKLKSAKAEKDKELNNLSATEKEIQDKIEDYKKQEAALEQQIKNAEKNNTSNGNNDKYTGGQFLWPCPASKRITSYFGGREQPVAGASTYHKGIDIGAPYGSDIVAAATGTVVTATYSASAGNYVMISHGSGLYTVYMHASKLVVSVGQKVSRGQVVAKVGSTGISTGNHLHFGVRKNGTYVNPLGYLQ